MNELKTKAEYLKIGLIDHLVTLDTISKWVDGLISNSERIPDWALELTFAKSKSIDEVITILNSIEGKADDIVVIRLLMLKVFETHAAGKIDFKKAISTSYQILLRQYNILQGDYSQDVRRLYLDIMSLDDGLDHYSNEKMGNLEQIKNGYLEFVEKIKEQSGKAGGLLGNPE